MVGENSTEIPVWLIYDMTTTRHIRCVKLYLPVKFMKRNAFSISLQVVVSAPRSTEHIGLQIIAHTYFCLPICICSWHSIFVRTDSCCISYSIVNPFLTFSRTLHSATVRAFGIRVDLRDPETFDTDKLARFIINYCPQNLSLSTVDDSITF